MKKNKNNGDVCINDDTEEKLNWGFLDQLKKDCGSQIITQLKLNQELAIAHEKTINDDDKLFTQIRGTNKTLEDLSKSVNETSKMHAGKTGFVEDTVDMNDTMAYISAVTSYASISESVLSISSTGYLDIFTSLQSATKDIDELKKLKDKVDGK